MPDADYELLPAEISALATFPESAIAMHEAIRFASDINEQVPAPSFDVHSRPLLEFISEQYV